MSMRAKHRASDQTPTQRKGDPGGGSLMSLDARCGAENGVVCSPVTVDDSFRLRADELDAEAAYYRRRAIQEQQALGPGYYVDLLRAMATDRATRAQRIRTGKAAIPSVPRESG